MIFENIFDNAQKYFSYFRWAWLYEFYVNFMLMKNTKNRVMSRRIYENLEPILRMTSSGLNTNFDAKRNRTHSKFNTPHQSFCNNMCAVFTLFSWQ